MRIFTVLFTVMLCSSIVFADNYSKKKNDEFLQINDAYQMMEDKVQCNDWADVCLDLLVSLRPDGFSSPSPSIHIGPRERPTQAQFYEAYIDLFVRRCMMVLPLLKIYYCWGPNSETGTIKAHITANFTGFFESHKATKKVSWKKRFKTSGTIYEKAFVTMILKRLLTKPKFKKEALRVLDQKEYWYAKRMLLNKTTSK